MPCSYRLRLALSSNRWRSRSSFRGQDARGVTVVFMTASPPQCGWAAPQRRSLAGSSGCSRLLRSPSREWWGWDGGSQSLKSWQPGSCPGFWGSCWLAAAGMAGVVMRTPAIPGETGFNSAGSSAVRARALAARRCWYSSSREPPAASWSRAFFKALAVGFGVPAPLDGDVAGFCGNEKERQPCDRSVRRPSGSPSCGRPLR